MDRRDFRRIFHIWSKRYTPYLTRLIHHTFHEHALKIKYDADILIEVFLKKNFAFAMIEGVQY